MRRIIPDNPLIFQEQALIFCPHDAAAHWLHRYFNHFLEWYAPDLAGAYLALQDIGACKVNNQFTLCKIKDSNRYRRILDYQRRAVKEEFEKFRFPPAGQKAVRLFGSALPEAACLRGRSHRGPWQPDRLDGNRAGY